jgi:hypothetical protein
MLAFASGLGHKTANTKRNISVLRFPACFLETTIARQLATVNINAMCRRIDNQTLPETRRRITGKIASLNLKRVIVAVSANDH